MHVSHNSVIKTKYLSVPALSVLL